MLAAAGLVVHEDHCELQNSHIAIVGLSAGTHSQLGLSGLGRSTMVGAEAIVALNCCRSNSLPSLIFLFSKLQSCPRTICCHSIAAGLSAGSHSQLGLAQRMRS